MRTSLLLPLLLLACTDGEPGKRSGAPDTGNADEDTEPLVDGCRATPRDADAARVALVSLPYTDDLGDSDAWAVLTLDGTGLSDTGGRIDLGWDRGGGLAFTPDGSIGITALDDGTLGVVSVSEAGAPTVLQTGHDPGTYVTTLAVDPTGEAVWLVNPNWPESGGGLYRAPIDCETGEVGAADLVVEAKNPAAIVLVGGSSERGLLVGREIPGAGEGADVALVDLVSGAVLAGSDAFGDDEAIVSSAGLADSGWLLIADHSEFSGLPNRVAAVPLEGDTLGEPLVVDDLYDPIAIVPNPVGPGAVVPSGYGDRYLVLGEDPGGARPWFIAGQVQEAGQEGVQLPEHAVAITRGALAGRTLAIEVGGVRSLQLDANGDATLGDVLGFGEGYSAIPGALGVQP
jgi:DNA-binding beta-propeller fold protein YncE